MSSAHPFARFVAALGRGPGRSRDLDETEAREAMTMILAGAVEPVQVGALLMLMRFKKETPAEIAGFVRAARDRIPRFEAAPAVDLDWPSYADRHKQLPWFVLAALLLAENGVRVLMHGIRGVEDGFVSTGAALRGLGIAPSADASSAMRRLASDNFAYLPLETLSPPLADLFALRPLLGLRSPVNSLARALNPLGAAHQIQGVFHPGYRALHQEAARHLGQPHAAIFKGGGGEGQRGPDKPCRVLTLRDGAPGAEDWPALTPGSGYPWREESTERARIPALWRGDYADPAPTAAVTGTAALALRLCGRAATMEEAQALAEALWRDRPKTKYGGV